MHVTSRPYRVKCRQWTIRLLTNTIVFVFLVGSSYAIFLSVENAENRGAVYQRSFQSALASGWNGIWQLIISFQVYIHYIILEHNQDAHTLKCSYYLAILCIIWVLFRVL